MTTVEIEQRLAAVEAEVIRLRAERDLPPKARLHPSEVLQATHGTFADDSAFQAAMRIGRQWRKSLDAKPRGKSEAMCKYRSTGLRVYSKQVRAIP